MREVVMEEVEKEVEEEEEVKEEKDVKEMMKCY